MSLLGDALGLQDYVIIGATRSPGYCVINGASLKRKWDIRNGYGAAGASTVFHGEELSEFSIDFFFWASDGLQIADWELFALMLTRKPTIATPFALGIKHPFLNEIGIDSVVLQELMQTEEVDETGLYKKTVKLLQYKKPLPMLTKPLATIPAAPKAVPTAQDAADLAIAAKLDAIKVAAAK